MVREDRSALGQPHYRLKVVIVSVQEQLLRHGMLPEPGPAELHLIYPHYGALFITARQEAPATSCRATCGSNTLSALAEPVRVVQAPLSQT